MMVLLRSKRSLPVVLVTTTACSFLLFWTSIPVHVVVSSQPTPSQRWSPSNKTRKTNNSSNNIQRPAAAVRPSSLSSSSSSFSTTTSTSSSSSPSSSSSSSSFSLEEKLNPLVSGRRACGLYLWDAPSAFFHAWCNRLMKDCVYEGLGGRKFVRIEPGSVLHLLYPCNRFSPDRCLICGGTFRDHLTLWWSKHLYTPYDRVLDEIYQRGVIQRTEGENEDDTNVTSLSPRTIRSKRRTKSQQQAVGTIKPKRIITQYVFHRLYVVEKKASNNKQSSGNRPTKFSSPQRRAATTATTTNNNKGDMNAADCTFGGITFTVPKLLEELEENKNYKNNKQPQPVFAAVLTRFLLYFKLSSLIYLEQSEMENNNNKMQKNTLREL